MRAKIFNFFTYFLMCISGLKELASAVNQADSPEDLDKLIAGGNR